MNEQPETRIQWTDTNGVINRDVFTRDEAEARVRYLLTCRARGFSAERINRELAALYEAFELNERDYLRACW